MNITFKYSGKEFWSAMNQTYGDSNVIKYVILAIIALAYGIYRTVSTSLEMISIVLIATSLFYLSVIFWRRLKYPILVFRKDTRYKEVYSLSLSEQEITRMAGSHKTTESWDYYLGIKESKDFLYLIDGEGKYVTIPKRVFKSPEEMNEFREFVRSKTDKSL